MSMGQRLHDLLFGKDDDEARIRNAWREAVHTNANVLQQEIKHGRDAKKASEKVIRVAEDAMRTLDRNKNNKKKEDG
jgi:hypothetical protein